jgi:hypothetical protein
LGPPSTQETVKKLENLGVSMRALIKEYEVLRSNLLVLMSKCLMAIELAVLDCPPALFPEFC